MVNAMKDEVKELDERRDLKMATRARYVRRRFENSAVNSSRLVVPRVKRALLEATLRAAVGLIV
eukprot:4776666-Pyramimonas_sp.AAC.1